ncbi:SDR family NAD(P)-dependent oxidoreductase [Methylocystis bryophila]|uniref:Acetoacetyl-CoA reductase n=1 Tax=Methylocystis bryophila TaxID=655015 RepID=A0A1W6MQW1_9HYPH|nr:SDR family NAD(P)-dependent oxidoreductase [Methylocystis bryophila]ARN79936.1 acetoacetyl-CoA reductase [Methylocystis bryophila]BDV39835.1 short-chain dehydrogenase [Methylocystis bryophila]
MNDTPQRILILGAASAIAEAAARLWAGQGARFALVARDAERLEAIAANLKALGAAETHIFVCDCAAVDARKQFEQMVAALGGLDVALLAYGTLGEQKALETDPKAVADLIATNFSSAVAWCLEIAALLERQRSGVLLVIGSVAGDRGRRSNFIYGACKGGLARLVEGIAHKLAPLGARAVVIKPGFVDTPMTAAFEKKGLLWAKPEAVAVAIVKASETGGPVVYAPAFWRLIMLAIRHLPVIIFNKLNI